MSKSSSNWFEVDTAGLKSLYAGKPRHYVIRELIQNALDEEITECRVTAKWKAGMASITVIDDSPEGFQNIGDAYTLYGHTRKRSHPDKRGIFNLGEKQAISLCESATIVTTTGTIKFERKGRKYIRRHESFKLERGSSISLRLKMTKAEFEQLDSFVNILIVPQNVKLFWQDVRLVAQPPLESFKAKLITTVLNKHGIVIRTLRNTIIEVHEPNSDGAQLHELGIPVCNIDCDYSLNVNQRVPLNQDRDMVSPAYLQDLYAELLNHMHHEIGTDNAASGWVRIAMSDERVSKNAVDDVLRNRFGDKFCSANPADPIANDDALANGYNLIHGSELSAEEWRNIKGHNSMPASSNLFGKTTVPSIDIAPDKNMQRVEALAEAISKKTLNKNIIVRFVKLETTHPAGCAAATYSKEHSELTFVLNKLDKSWFEPSNIQGQVDLIIHELGHEYGHHTEKSYHEALTRIAAKLVMIALETPTFFRAGEK